MKSATLEEALAIALRLGHKERLHLIERIAASVEQELDNHSLRDEKPKMEHWGQSLNQLLDQLGPIDLVDPQIEDPVEWVKYQREKRRHQRTSEWDE